MLKKRRGGGENASAKKLRTTRSKRIEPQVESDMYPVDKVKLDRVRDMMKAQGFTALVCRAPDNIVYLSNYWCMKGYDSVVFPAEGEPTLCAIEPQLADAKRTSWTKDIRLF